MDANDICIDVHTQYLEDRFPETEEKYAFAYKITITNNSKDEVTLLNRYWLITDGNGDISEVSGKGVVGEQPVIKPGEHYQCATHLQKYSHVSTQSEPPQTIHRLAPACRYFHILQVPGF